MSRLLDDLLDMSRLTMEHLRLERARFDLRTAIEPSIEIVAGRAEERGQTMRVALPSKPVEVFGDAARLEQVFANLLSNAVRYTPHGGAITVTLGVDGEWAVVEVIDTGDGIAADDLARIFDPFSRGTSGNAEGLGIGLTLVRGLVELHGGSVQAESPGAGGGSTFTVRLPVVR
jgi:signal transduction histidine kinase